MLFFLFAIASSHKAVRTGDVCVNCRTQRVLWATRQRDGADSDNYYRFYDPDAILAADAPSDPRPYAYGIWDPPFGLSGSHKVIGGSFAPDRGLLYLALSGAGQVGSTTVPHLSWRSNYPSTDRRTSL
ncbi:MAG: hypothetical protein ACI9KE_003986 [Polyangiales bacterium]|jgi:hypothetical protein